MTVKTEKEEGKMIIIHMSTQAVLFPFLPSSVDRFASSKVFFGDLLYFLKHRIIAYSKIAMMMKKEHNNIHCMMAVTAPPDFGEFAASEFSMLIMQRKRVNKNPIRPGTESSGNMKLICNIFLLFSIRGEILI